MIKLPFPPPIFLKILIPVEEKKSMTLNELQR